MPDNEIVVQQINAISVQIETLPDGSIAVFDTATQSIHSLDPLAAAAFAACRDRRTLSQLIDAMSQISGVLITEVVALHAISELERAGLVACSQGTQSATESASRRSLLRAAGAAMPLVLSLTSLEQSAFAQRAGSGILATTTTTAAPTTTTTTTTTTPAPTPSIIAVSPPTIGNGCNSTINGVVITGQNTHFSGASVVSFNNPALAASNVTVLSPTSLRLTATVSGRPLTQPALVNVTVVTGSETAVGVGVYSIVSCD